MPSAAAPANSSRNHTAPRTTDDASCTAGRISSGKTTFFTRLAFWRMTGADALTVSEKRLKAAMPQNMTAAKETSPPGAVPQRALKTMPNTKA